MSLPYVQPGEPISAARFNALVEAVNAAANVVGAYPIEVDRHATGATIGLASQAKLWLFRIAAFSQPVSRTSDDCAYYPATRIRLDGDDEYAPGEPDDVRLYDPLARGELSATLAEGDEALAQFNADTGRWEIVRSPSSGFVKRFRLTASLALGSSAAAVIETWDADTSAYVDGDAVTVRSYGGAANPPGAWSGPAGYRGFAIELEGRYEILWMQRVALFVRFTLAEDMGDTTPGVSLAAGVNAHWRGQNPGTQVNVHDAAGIHADKLTGDKGVACWNDALARYEILDMEQAGVKIQWAYATADWTNVAGNGAYVVCELADPQSKDATAGDGEGTFNVYLPRRGVPRDPNVRQGAVVGFVVDDEGNRICITDYLDDKILSIKLFHGSIGNIPAGWQLCDGTNGTPDLREKFVLGAFGDSGGTSNFDGDSHGTAIGSTGGRRTHTHDAHNFNLPHLRSGSSALRTEDESLSLTSSPGFTVETTEVELEGSLSGSAEVEIGGVTGPAVVTVTGSGLTDAAHLESGAASEAMQPLHDGGSFIGWYAHASMDTDPNLDTTGVDPTDHYHDITNFTASEEEPGHTHVLEEGEYEILFDNVQVAINPPSHKHEVLISDIAGAIEIDPNPHHHEIILDNHAGTLTHSTENHVNPYYALAYIMRVN